MALLTRAILLAGILCSLWLYSPWLGLLWRGVLGLPPCWYTYYGVAHCGYTYYGFSSVLWLYLLLLLRSEPGDAMQRAHLGAGGRRTVTASYHPRPNPYPNPSPSPLHPNPRHGAAAPRSARRATKLQHTAARRPGQWRGLGLGFGLGLESRSAYG